jgi:hypothetical protein
MRRAAFSSLRRVTNAARFAFIEFVASPKGAATNAQNQSKELCAMKMNSAQIEQTLQQFKAQAIPGGHPVMPQLQRLFGDHTYFLDGKGLNIVEPVDEERESRRAVVVNLADWDNRAEKNNLEPHPPEVTDLVIDLEVDSPH